MMDDKERLTDTESSDGRSAAAPEEQPSAPAASLLKRRKTRTVFYISVVAVALAVFAASVSTSLKSVLGGLIDILAPLIVGIVIAYLCDPILEFFEYRIFRRMKKGGLRRGLSLFLTLLTVLGIFAMIGVLIIPQLYQSITSLFKNSDKHIGELLGWLQSIIERLPGNLEQYVDISNQEKFTAFIEKIFGSAENALSGVLADIQKLLADGDIVAILWKFFSGMFTAFKNLFLGLFIAFYILASKEKRVAQIKKFRRAMFSESTNARIDEASELADRTFGGFIFGKILDSLVIGILSFVLLTIFNVSPYNILIASLIGVANIIPVFGPIIGAIPAFFIVLISSPGKAFIFLLLVLIIQQLDGNVIAPKILGDNTGISSLCVIIAISVCGSLWGIPGMILGVPIFAMVIEIFKRWMELRLEAKGVPTDTLAYYPTNTAINAEEDVYYEHAHLLYRYEHSKLKPKVDRLKTKLFDRPARTGKSAEPDSSSTDHKTDRD